MFTISHVGTHVPLLQQFVLLLALHQTTALGFAQHLYELLLDGMCHALGVTADINVSSLFEDEGSELVAEVPYEILDVDFA